VVSVSGGTERDAIARYLDAIVGHDWEAFAATLSDDDFTRIGPYGDEYPSKREYVAFISELMPTLPGYEMRVDRVTYSGDRRLAVAELSETVDIDGSPLVTPEALVFDLDDRGRIRRIQIFIQKSAPR
jgi:ketosteroid isomerase-like protein